MQNAPKVSVVIPMYNAEQFLGQTLESLAQQEFIDWELVAVDDGSTDASPLIVEAFSKVVAQRVSLIQQTNLGGAAARNAGVAAARGEFIAFLDADDLWHPSKLRMQVQALVKDSQLIGVSTGYFISTSNASSETTHVIFSWSFQEVIAWMLGQGRGPAFNSTFLVRSKVLASVGGFDEKLRYAEDLDMAWRLTNTGEIGVVPNSLTKYRRWSGQIHRNPELMDTSMRYIYSKYFSSSPDFLSRANRYLDVIVGLRLIQDRRLLAGFSRVIRGRRVWWEILSSAASGDAALGRIFAWAAATSSHGRKTSHQS